MHKYKIINEDVLYKKVANTVIYNQSEYIKQKVNAFLISISIYTNSKQVSDYPLLYLLTSKIKYNKDTYILSA